MSAVGVVNFPVALDDSVSLIDQANDVGTATATANLTATLNAADTTATVDDTSRMAASGSASAESEIFTYAAKTPTTLTGLLRGREGTTAATHLSGVMVEQRYTARSHTVLRDAIAATQAKLGTGTSTPIANTLLFAGATGASAWANTITGTFTVTPPSAAGVPLTLKGAVSQTGPLLDLRDSSNNVLGRIDASARMVMPLLTKTGAFTDADFTGAGLTAAADGLLGFDKLGGALMGRLNSTWTRYSRTPLTRANVEDFGASGSGNTYLLSSWPAANQITLATAHDFQLGQGIAVPGAAAAGASLVTTVTAIAGNTLTLGASATTQVVAVGLTDAVPTAPIEVVTASAHGYTSGMTVVISGVVGNTAANGTWVIKVTSTTRFTLDQSAGNGQYASGGTATPAIRHDETAAIVAALASLPQIGGDLAYGPGFFFSGKFTSDHDYLVMRGAGLATRLIQRGGDSASFFRCNSSGDGSTNTRRTGFELRDMIIDANWPQTSAAGSLGTIYVWSTGPVIADNVLFLNSRDAGFSASASSQTRLSNLTFNGIIWGGAANFLNIAGTSGDTGTRRYGDATLTNIQAYANGNYNSCLNFGIYCGGTNSGRVAVSNSLVRGDVVPRLDTALTGNNNDLSFRAKIGKTPSIAYVNPGTPSAALSVVVTNSATATPTITVNLATDGASAITSTAKDVAWAIARDATASTLVSVGYSIWPQGSNSLSATDDGSGVVTALATTQLAAPAGGNGIFLECAFTATTDVSVSNTIVEGLYEGFGISGGANVGGPYGVRVTFMNFNAHNCRTGAIIAGREVSFVGGGLTDCNEGITWSGGDSPQSELSFTNGTISMRPNAVGRAINAAAGGAPNYFASMKLTVAYSNLLGATKPVAPLATAQADTTAGQIWPGAGTSTVQYAIAHLSSVGESIIGALSTPVTIDSTHTSVLITRIPLGAQGTLQRTLYRTTFAPGTVLGASNPGPISLNVTAHGYSTGDVVLVSNVGGNTAANGLWKITVTDANNFTLTGSTGNGAWTSGGTTQKLAKVVTFTDAATSAATQTYIDIAPDASLTTAPKLTPDSATGQGIQMLGKIRYGQITHCNISLFGLDAVALVSFNGFAPTEFAIESNLLQDCGLRLVGTNQNAVLLQAGCDRIKIISNRMVDTGAGTMTGGIVALSGCTNLTTHPNEYSGIATPVSIGTSTRASIDQLATGTLGVTGLLTATGGVSIPLDATLALGGGTVLTQATGGSFAMRGIGGNKNMIFGADSGLYLICDRDNSSTTDKIFFAHDQEGSGSTLMVIQENGLVGIGTGSSAIAGAQLASVANAVGNISVVARGMSGQTASLFEAQINGPTTVLSITKDGHLVFADAINIQAGTVTGTQIGTTALQKIGLWGHAPAAQPGPYVLANVTPTRTFDPTNYTMNQMAQVLATLIQDFQSFGAVG